MLDSLLKEDSVSDLWSKFVVLDEMKCKADQNIQQYMADFVIKYNELKILGGGVTLYLSILACMLTRRCDLPYAEHQLVMIGLDLAAPDKLYEQAKQALKKFKEKGMFAVAIDVENNRGNNSRLFSVPVGTEDPVL